MLNYTMVLKRNNYAIFDKIYNGEYAMKKKIFALLLSVAMTASLLTGCGSDEGELDSYRSAVEAFYDDVVEINDNINAIDAESEKAAEDLLSELDDLNSVFQDFADLNVPREYAAIEDLADEAASLMDEAVALYHSSFNEGTFNDFSAGMAYEKYCRAIVRINYIGDILQGKTIEGDNINIIYEEE